LILCYFDEQERARKLGEFGEFEMTKIYDLTTGYEKFIPLSLFDLNRAYLFSLWKVFSVPYRGPYVQIFRIL